MIGGLRYVVRLALAALLTVVPGSAGAEAATCRGLPVTIESSSDGVITGTAGPDVVLARYGTWGHVDTGAGDDVVCIEPGPPSLPPGGEAGFSVFVGDGDDVVDAT